MSDARDEREWLKKERREDAHESIYSPGEEIGEMHFNAENFTTALEYFIKALDRPDLPAYPERFRLLLRISDCHRKRGDFAAATQFIDEARSAGEALPVEALGRIEYREGYLLLWQGQYDDALKAAFSAYRKLKQSESHGEVAYIQLLIANCYQRLGSSWTRSRPIAARKTGWESRTSITAWGSCTRMRAAGRARWRRSPSRSTWPRHSGCRST
jgi:tetratricopeptide (TPR) repeat protein